MPEKETFRDKVSTIDRQGRRIWIYPKKPSGPLYNARTVVSILLLAVLFSGPFIKINGQPLLLLNILERRFIIFGKAFWPQDFHLFVLGTIALVIFIVLFTVIYGRLFCGWACPQTIFMEMVFRKIEYWIEGDANRQRKRNAAPMTAGKFTRKAVKHSIFFAISFLIGNTFLAYIIGIDRLFEIVTDPPTQHLGGLSAMILFSGAFYFVFAFFREQACTMVCPYGRLQGVLLDPNSIVVAYDFKRGEPRGKRRARKAEDSLGDCIDCHLCVQVCPTGIDIRDGTQLECVNCTACIDACNNVMQKVKKPKGLIRYASYNGIVSGERLKFTPRIAGYSFVLLLIVGLLTTLLLTRSPIEATILRTPGTLYQELAGGIITNLYNVKIINKTFEEMDIGLQLSGMNGQIEIVGGQLLVPSGGLSESTFFIKLPRNALKRTNTMLDISVLANGQPMEVVRTSFIGPNPFQKEGKP